MKHSDWLRLNSEGDMLARFFAEKGYRVAKKKPFCPGHYGVQKKATA